MRWLVYALSLMLPVSSYLWFQIGRRYERGKREVELDRLEEERERRSRRPGTIRLRPMRIRR